MSQTPTLEELRNTFGKQLFNVRSKVEKWHLLDDGLLPKEMFITGHFPDDITNEEMTKEALLFLEIFKLEMFKSMPYLKIIALHIDYTVGFVQVRFKVLQ
ncbi:hypothetical protein [Mangrovimonas cancribranchiae]|uniref:Uncharacterized protein n=1 Tax=Mangrovimonas cancribranchiae TaxID=3080055 RepID=A0AAU6P4V8_9FLAO